MCSGEATRIKKSEDGSGLLNTKQHLQLQVKHPDKGFYLFFWGGVGFSFPPETNQKTGAQMSTGHWAFVMTQEGSSSQIMSTFDVQGRNSQYNEILPCCSPHPQDLAQPLTHSRCQQKSGERVNQSLNRGIIFLLTEDLVRCGVWQCALHVSSES